jgi:formiminoglutamase
MKILTKLPRDFVSSRQLDNSALGLHVTAVNPSGLDKIAPGIVFVGAADDSAIENSGGRKGAALGPDAVRSRIYRLQTGAPKIPIYDLGDHLFDGTLRTTHRSFASLVENSINAGHVPLVIGGGHDYGYSHALGCLRAQKKKPLHLVNIDAHLDCRPFDPAITSGSPWRLLAEETCWKESKSQLTEFGAQPFSNAQSLWDYAKEKKFRLVTWQKVNKRNPLAQLKSLLSKTKAPFLLSLDLDSVRAVEAPGVSAPQWEGFTAENYREFSFWAGKSKGSMGLGIFELSPPLDPSGLTAQLAAQCTLSFLLGKNALSQTWFMDKKG